MSPNAEQTDNFDAEERPAAEKKPGSRLSAVSKMYDRDGKGYLDEKEQVMRDMDQSNRGFLSNDKVYKMLEEQMTMQKKMVSQRWMIIGLCVFAVVLALANMGTAFAAARLSKDTRVVQAEAEGAPMLTDLNGNALATKTTGSKVEITSGGCVNIYEMGQFYKEVSKGSPAVLSVEDETTGETAILPVNGATSSEDFVCFSSAASTSPRCFSLTKSCGTSTRRLRSSNNGQTLSDTFYHAVSGSSEFTSTDKHGRDLQVEDIPPEGGSEWVDCSTISNGYCNSVCRKTPNAYGCAACCGYDCFYTCSDGVNDPFYVNDCKAECSGTCSLACQ